VKKRCVPCPFPTSYLHHSWFSIQDTSNLPTKHVDQRMSPTPPSSAFSTPGRVLGGASPEPMRDAYTGQRIYSPTDPNHPSRRPISSAFKKKYKRYYDEASPQMPQHLFVRPVNSLYMFPLWRESRYSGISPVSKATLLIVPLSSRIQSLSPSTYVLSLHYYSWLVLYLTSSSCIITQMTHCPYYV